MTDSDRNDADFSHDDGPSDGDGRLDDGRVERAIRELRSRPLPPLPPGLNDRTEAAMAAAAEEPVRRSRDWSRTMRVFSTTLAGVGGAALILLVGLLLTQEPSAADKLRDKLAAAKQMSAEAEQEEPAKKATRKLKLPPSIKTKVLCTNDGRSRVEIGGLITVMHPDLTTLTWVDGDPDGFASKSQLPKPNRAADGESLNRTVLMRLQKLAEEFTPDVDAEIPEWVPAEASSVLTASERTDENGLIDETSDGVDVTVFVDDAGAPVAMIEELFHQRESEIKDVTITYPVERFGEVIDVDPRESLPDGRSRLVKRFFNVALSDEIDGSLFPTELPDGYEEYEPPKVPLLEQHLTEALERWTKVSGGSLPASITDGDLWLTRFREARGGRTSWDFEGRGAMASLGWMLQFLVDLEADDYAYLGAGKSVGDGSELIFWFRDDGKLRGVYDDLTGREITEDELP